MNALKAANIFLDAPCGGKGTCHKCSVQISSDSASWKTVKACQTKISSSLYIDTAKSKRKHRILTEAAARSVPYLPSAKISEELPCYLAAFDIGTTTIASYLLDGQYRQTAWHCQLCQSPGCLWRRRHFKGRLYHASRI